MYYWHTLQIGSRRCICRMKQSKFMQTYCIAPSSYGLKLDFKVSCKVFLLHLFLWVKVFVVTKIMKMNDHMKLEPYSN